MAQQPPRFGTPPTSTGNSTQGELPSDTSRLTYTFASRPELSFDMGDTMPYRDFYMVDPARQQRMDWANLGNIGSPARPLFYQTTWRQGYQIGAKVFDVYGVELDSMRFYQSKGALTDVQYAQGRGQPEGVFRGRFARTFSDGINFSLNYRGINHQGQFVHQRVKHNAIQFGLWIPKKKRWQGFLVFNQNIFRQQENGGIADSVTSIVSGELSGPLGVPINLSEKTALSRVANWSAQCIQHLDLIGKKDARKLSLVHKVAFGGERDKFFDRANNEDGLSENAAFYGSQIYTYPRGIRNYWHLRRFENELTLRTFKVRPNGGNDQLNAGIHYSRLDIDHSPNSEKQNQVFLMGNAAFQFKRTLGIEARAALGLLDNTGEYNLEGRIFWDLGKAGRITGELLQQNVRPFALHEQLYLSDVKVWENDFQNINETRLSGTYSLPAIGLRATVQNQTLVNFVYVAPTQEPVQLGTGSPINITQLLVEEDFRMGILGMENTVALQQTNNSDALGLPSWYYRGSLFAEGLIFRKNMLARLGLQSRLNAPFFGDAYSPFSWQFYRQNARQLPTYPWFDLFLAVKVQNLRFFARYENVADAFWTDNLHFLTKNQPQMPAQFRISLAWRFRDL